MSDVFELQAQLRESLGKSAARRVRRVEDLIPAVIYGAGEDPLHIQIDHGKVLKALENEAFYSHILTIDVNGNKQKTVLKAVQRHPYKPKVVHMDFQRISAKEKITMHVPLHFLGEATAPGVKKGGIISHLETSVNVNCLPANLPEYIEVDVSNLGLDESIHLSDIKAPHGVEFTDLAHGHDKTLVSIHIPRAQAVEEATPAAEETTGSE